MRRHRTTLAIGCLMLGAAAASPSWANKTSEPLKDYYVVTFGSYRNKLPAAQAAKQAWLKLKLPLAEDTVRDPPAQRLIEQDIVSLYQPRPGTFAVAVHMGADQAEARRMLGKTRRVFKNAKVVRVKLDEERVTTVPRMVNWIIVLAAKKKYADALAFARKAAAAGHVPYWSRDLLHDAEHGLHWPDPYDEDPVYAGGYYPRRDNNCKVGNKDAPRCITVEHSGAYYGSGKFREGYYLVVGGLYGEAEYQRELARYRKIAPDAYAKRLNLWVGCIH